MTHVEDILWEHPRAKAASAEEITEGRRRIVEIVSGHVMADWWIDNRNKLRAVIAAEYRAKYPSSEQEP